MVRWSRSSHSVHHTPGHPRQLRLLLLSQILCKDSAHCRLARHRFITFTALTDLMTTRHLKRDNGIVALRGLPWSLHLGEQVVAVGGG
jgi:hypothetical protein